jgi:hypothetical protein
MFSINLKTAITLAAVGLLTNLFCLPLLWGKVKRNRFYGFRLAQAFVSEEEWARINRYGAKALMLWGWMLAGAGLACLYVQPANVLTISQGAFLSILLPILLTMRHARR